MRIQRKQYGLALAALVVAGTTIPTLLSAQASKSRTISHIASVYANAPATDETAAMKSPEYQKYYKMFKGAAHDVVYHVDLTKTFAPIAVQRAPKIATCFGGAESPEMVKAFHDAMSRAGEGAWPVLGDTAKDYFNGTRWPGTEGTPYTVTWSLVPDGVSISGGAGEPTANNVLFSTLDSQFASQGGRTTWVTRFQNIFDRWAQLCGLSYTRIKSGANDWDDGAAWGSSGSATRGDIRIAGHFIDGASGPNILAYNYFPGTGNGGDMVIDTANSWSSTTNNNRFLRNTLGHEHGHGLAASHVCPANNTKLMEPSLSTSFDGPQQDDIRNAMELYGDPFEKSSATGNNTSATASNLGTLAVPSTTTFGTTPADPVSVLAPSNTSVMSLHATGPDQDYYAVTVNSAANLAVTVTPIGSTYLNGVQNGDGSCSAGSNFNALSVANLDFQIRDTNGTTVLLTQATAAAGSAESGNVNLPGTGTYFVRVYSSAVTQTQLYRLTLQTSVISGNTAPVLNPVGNKTINELANLSFSLTSSDVDAGQTRTYSMTGAPTGATLNPTTGAFSWTPTEAQGPGSYNVTFSVTDNGTPNLSDSETITITVNEVNVAPDATNVNNATINENSLYSFNASGTDSDVPAQTLTYSLVGAPTGAVISSSSGTFVWTPTEAQGGNPNTAYSFFVRISDGVTNTDKPITLTVQEVNANPTVTNTTTAFTVNEGSLLNFTATGSDTDLPAQTLSFSLSGAPTGMTINPSTGLVSWTPTEAQGPQTYNFSIIVTDNGPGNLTGAKNFSVTVNEVNQAPSLTVGSTYNATEGVLLNFSASATDADLPAQTLTYSLIGAPTGAGINPSTGVFSWTPTTAQSGTSHVFQVRVTDNGSPNLNDTETVTINVAYADKSITGTLNLQNYIGSATPKTSVPIVFEIRAVGSTTPIQTVTASVNASDQFTLNLTGLPAGTYDIAAKPDHWLRDTLGSVVVGYTGATGLSFDTINGDIDGDNVVSIFDYIALSDAFDSADGDPGWNPNADLDGDGVVSIFDYIILSDNFDKTGDD